jgi:hypothetical protein
MYAFLVFLSVLTTAIGFFAVGFGLAPYELSLGNALVTAGSVAIVGGFIMFGLAAAVRQLRRIADAVGPRAVAAPARRQPAPEQAEPAPQRAAPAPRPPYPTRPEARPAPAAELPELPIPERPRPNVFGVARGSGETPVVEEPDAVPLAPSRPAAAPVARGAPPIAEPPGEPRPSPADIMARLGNLAASPRPAPHRMPAADQRAPAPGQQRDNMFDALWPAEVRGARQSQPETIARAPRAPLRPDPRAEPRGEPRMEAKADVNSEPRIDGRTEGRADARADMRQDARHEPRSEPKPEPRHDPRAEPRFEAPMMRERMEAPMPSRERIEPAAAPPAAEPRPIAILKSGVIDGMAYTLYTDGSIEAELPQGTMRFGSIDELRSHLEKAERQD